MDVTGQKEEVRMEELIARARAGDGAAFAQLMEGQKQMLYKVARSYLRSDADAADAMGETVLSCYEKLDTLRQPRYFRTWLTRILIRKCQDILRRQGRCVPLEEVPEPAGEEPGHARAEFLALLDSLDEKYRTVLLLYYGEGFQTTEIARILDLKEETVKTRLKRARAGFRQIYEAE
jgi:RNA polymerase sigma factor (sigma-70 family)